MLQYSLEVGICWAILYLVYIVFLRRETFFSINRWYLLGSLVLGLLIPVLRAIPAAFQEEVVVVHEALYFISAGPELIASNIATPIESESVLTLSNFLLLVYLIGVIVVGSRLVSGLSKIYDLYNSGNRIAKKSFTLVETTKFHLPFSFLNCVFFSKELPVSDDIEKILKHELTHVHSWHTLDVLFTEVLQVIFWFNPLIILYKKAIKESHEYVADASVLQDTSQKIYGQILLRQSQSGIQIALANHFFHSHIKNRLNMMKQKKSKWPAMGKYLFSLPAVLLLVMIFSNAGIDKNSQHDLIEDTNKHELFQELDAMSQGGDYNSLNSIVTDYLESEKIVFSDMQEYLDEYSQSRKIKISLARDKKDGESCYQISSTIYHDRDGHRIDVVDHPETFGDMSYLDQPSATYSDDENQKARFPGCEESGLSAEELQSCSEQKLREYVTANLEYPDEARRQGVQGMIPVKLMINEVGQVDKVEQLRSLGSGTKEAIFKLFAKMNEEIKWIPGIEDGKLAKQNVVVSVPFKLENGHPYMDSYATHTIENPDYPGLYIFDNYGPNVFYSFYTKSKEEATFKLFNVEGKVVDSYKVIPTSKEFTGFFKPDRTQGQVYYIEATQGDFKQTKKVLAYNRSKHDTGLLLDHNDDPGNEEGSTCKAGDDGVYFWSDVRPHYPACEYIEDDEERSRCTNDAVNKFFLDRLQFPEEGIRQGFQGRIIYMLTIDEEGNIVEAKLPKNMSKPKFGYHEESLRIIELMKEEVKFTPAECDGKKVKSWRALSPTIVLTDAQKDKVIVKNSETVDQVIQNLTFHSASEEYGLSFFYNSNMNVPLTINVFDPNGQKIYTKDWDYIYKRVHDGVTLSNPINGRYKILAIQDGVVKESEMDVDVFESE